MTTKQFTGTRQISTHYLHTCIYAYNTFASPVLDGLSPFQLSFDRSSNILIELETKP